MVRRVREDSVVAWVGSASPHEEQELQMSRSEDGSGVWVLVMALVMPVMPSTTGWNRLRMKRQGSAAVHHLRSRRCWMQ